MAEKKALVKAFKSLGGVVEHFAVNIYKVQVTPMNVANFEEAFNNFLAREGDTGSGTTFKLRFTCKKAGELSIDHVEAFKGGVKVMG